MTFFLLFLDEKITKLTHFTVSSGTGSEETTDEPEEGATEASVEEVTEKPIEEVTEEPIEEVTEEPIEEVTDEPAKEITEEPVEEVTEVAIAAEDCVIVFHVNDLGAYAPDESLMAGETENVSSASECARQCHQSVDCVRAGYDMATRKCLLSTVADPLQECDNANTTVYGGEEQQVWLQCVQCQPIAEGQVFAQGSIIIRSDGSIEPQGSSLPVPPESQLLEIPPTGCTVTFQHSSVEGELDVNEFTHRYVHF